MCAGA